MLEDVGDDLGMKDLIDNIMCFRVLFVPFLAVLIGLGDDVFHPLVKAQHASIEAIDEPFSVNQWNEDGVDDDAEEDDGEDDVSDEHGGFKVGDIDKGLGGQYGSGQSFGVESRHEGQLLVGDVFFL